MGSIQNRRGSARQAPPDVYLPFFSSRDEHDVGKECAKVAGDGLAFICACFIIAGAIAVVRGIRSLL